MSVIARRIASIPVRSASDTWLRMVEILAPTNAEGRAELLAVTGVSASLVAREAMRDSPVIVVGDKGPRIRLYCVHGEAAIEGTNVNEASLPGSPVEGAEWAVSLPCPEEDLAWVQASLARVSGRITARDTKEPPPPEPAEEASEKEATIDLESFLRP